MWEKDLNRRLVLIGLVIAFAAWMLSRPDALRGGLDIEGGVAMIFEIDDTGLGDFEKSTLAEDMVRLLKKRVDPKGVFGLNWRVMGRNRIEIQMPLPPAGVKERREEFTRALEALFRGNLKVSQIEEACRLSGEERSSGLRALAADSDERMKLLETASVAYQAWAAAREAAAAGVPAESQEPQTSQPTTEPAKRVTQRDLEDARFDAESELDAAIDEVLALNIDPARFRDMLELGTNSQTRKAAQEQFVKDHANLKDQIEDVVARFDAWNANRGYLDGPADLQRLLRGAGMLDWRILAEPDPENPTRYDHLVQQLTNDGPRIRPGDTEAWFRVDSPSAFFNLDSASELQRFEEGYQNFRNMIVGKFAKDYYILSRIEPQFVMLTKSERKWQLKSAMVDRDRTGRLCATFQLDPVGGGMFEHLTGENLNKQLCIFLDDVAYSSATIQSRIRERGQITGDFSREKVNYLVQTMQGGALPARLKDTPLSERTIEARLGQANLQRALRAGIIGVILVGVFMAVYYMVGGMIANLAIVMNIVFVLAAMAMLGARFSLDGIAGVILTIGMSVDANVLIFERMREERERGASLRMMIKNGYDKAFSTIIDANITTLLTCLILYYFGSEEVKGFGLTLGWGIVVSMFTSLFVTRTIFTALVKYNLIKDVKMLKLIGVPNINWYGMRRIFVPVSLVVALGGMLTLFLFRSKEDLFDVEFLGGVSVTVETTDPNLTADDIQQRLADMGQSIAADAGKISDATVSPVLGVPSQYLLSVAGMDADRIQAIVTEPLENLLQRDGVDAHIGENRVALRLKSDTSQEQLAAGLAQIGDSLATAGENIGEAKINRVRESGVVSENLFWSVVTTETNRGLVRYALVNALAGKLNIRPKLTYQYISDDGRPYPIEDRRLRDVIAGLPGGAGGNVTDYRGGAAFYFDEIDPPQTLDALRTRLSDMRLQPPYDELPWRQAEVFGVTAIENAEGDALYSGVVVVVADPNIRYSEDPDLWLTELAQPELELARATMDREQSLQKVTQFKPQIAGQSQRRAIMALVFSWVVIIAYVWIRFGTVIYGIAGVAALIHDVLIALAFIGFSGVLGGEGGPLRFLLMDDFKIDMTIVAAFLTIIGFSINDTIVIFDRIRETRGRLGIITPDVINRSINQCMSRTVLTSLTTFFVLAVMYIFGGETIRGFNFCMMIGVLTGTYSSIAVAAPLLMLGKKAQAAPSRA